MRAGARAQRKVHPRPAKTGKSTKTIVFPGDQVTVLDAFRKSKKKASRGAFSLFAERLQNSDLVCRENYRFDRIPRFRRSGVGISLRARACLCPTKVTRSQERANSGTLTPLGGAPRKGAVQRGRHQAPGARQLRNVNSAWGRANSGTLTPLGGAPRKGAVQSANPARAPAQSRYFLGLLPRPRSPSAFYSVPSLARRCAAQRAAATLTLAAAAAAFECWRRANSGTLTPLGGAPGKGPFREGATRSRERANSGTLTPLGGAPREGPFREGATGCGNAQTPRGRPRSRAIF